MRGRGVLLGVVLASLPIAEPAGGAPATQAYHVVCARQALTAGEQVEVRLEPAPPPGTDIYWRDAKQNGRKPASPLAAPGQTYSTDVGTIGPGYRLESVTVHMSEPEYPKSAVSRGLTDVVPLSVLLCAEGRVLVAYPVTSYGDDGLPIEHEPILTDAAVTVARSRTFTPLVSDSAPIAGWIQVQIGRAHV